MKYVQSTGRQKMSEQKKEAVWNILNNFRIKYFFSELTSQIDVGDFDKMMDMIKDELNFQIEA